MNRKRWAWTAAIAVVLSIIVGACSNPVYVRAEKDGWLLEYTYKRFRCPSCTADVKRFEVDGHSVPLMPILQDGHHNAVWVETPVGAIQCDAISYRPMHGREFAPLKDPVTIGADELRQG